MDTVLLLNHDHMGHGDTGLGERILKTFLQKSRALGGLEAVLLVNSGVRLVAVGSPVRAELKLMEDNGVDIVPCGTCLSFYEVEPAVGEVGSMDEIVASLDKAGKVITL
jgi:RNase P/RNase MRP subunit p30